MVTFDFEKTQKLHSIVLNMQEEIRDRIDSLNNGGCVHFAYFFHKELVKHKINHKVYFMDYFFTPVSVEEPPNHVVIKIEGIGVIDGYKTKKGFSHYRKHYKKDLRKIMNHSDWNNQYDKSQNRLLSSIIKEHLNDY